MTAHPDGSGATRVPLPFTDLYPDRPAWSLDGRTLLFTRDSSDGIEGGHPMEIYRVNRDGSGLRVLAQGAHSPSWSPRGHGRIAYAESGHCFSVFTMTSTGRHKRRVLDANPRRHTHCHQFFTQIDWSPSGRQIAFTGPGGGVMVSDLRGHMRRLSRTGVSPVWSPDGRQIAWTESRSRNYRVVSIALVIATTAGRVQRRIPGAAIDSWQPLR